MDADIRRVVDDDARLAVTAESDATVADCAHAALVGELDAARVPSSIAVFAVESESGAAFRARSDPGFVTESVAFALQTDVVFALLSDAALVVEIDVASAADVGAVFTAGAKPMFAGRSRARFGASDAAGFGASDAAGLGASDIARLGASDIARLGASDIARLGVTDAAGRGASDAALLRVSDAASLGASGDGAARRSNAAIANRSAASCADGAVAVFAGKSATAFASNSDEAFVSSPAAAFAGSSDEAFTGDSDEAFLDVATTVFTRNALAASVAKSLAAFADDSRAAFAADSGVAFAADAGQARNPDTDIESDADAVDFTVRSADRIFLRDTAAVRAATPGFTVSADSARGRDEAFAVGVDERELDAARPDVARTHVPAAAGASIAAAACSFLERLLVTRSIEPSSWTAQPWRNGGGITHEVARRPAGAVDAFDVRLSLAAVMRSGPFSRFDGFRRWSFLAGDAPISLVTPAGVHELLALGDRVELPGDVPIDAVLSAGPTHLFNVLVRDGVPLVVGHGRSAHPVRWLFALAATPALARWHALELEPPRAAAVDDTVWIADLT